MQTDCIKLDECVFWQARSFFRIPIDCRINASIVCLRDDNFGRPKLRKT